MNLSRKSLLVILLSASWLVAAEAQEPGSGLGADTGQVQATTPAEETSTSPGGDAQAVPAPSPDRRPLGGSLDLGLGAESGRSFLQPSFRVSQSVDSNPGGQGGNALAVTNVAGTLALERFSRRSHSQLSYTLAGAFYGRHSELNAAFQRLEFTHSVQFNRWQLSLSDQASYLPESPFGFNGIAGVGGGFGNLNGVYLPNQTILTGRNSRILNTVAGDARYDLSARSSLHLTSSFDVTRYQEPGFANSQRVTVGGGFDRALTPHDTLGISYTLGMLRYGGGSNQEINSHSISLLYGRRVTGRLALQLGGGPLIGTNNALLFNRRVSWNVRGSLRYRLPQMEVEASFRRNLDAGGGTLVATINQVLEATLARQLSRTWWGSLSLGVARNTSAFRTTGNELSVNTQFAGFSLTHPVDRTKSVFFNYNFQHQTSPAALCVGCQTEFARHVVGIGFEWHLRPLALGSW